MKVSFPLSLKFSLWLLLNLLLLGALGLGFFAVTGETGWDALARGPTGKRMQELGAAIVGEFTSAEATNSARQAVLDRFAARYGVTFFLLHPNLTGAADPREVLPAFVSARVEEADPVGRRPGPPKEFGPPPRDGGRSGNNDLREREESRGRFLVRGGEPSTFWIGVRIPLGRPPITLVARVDSWWRLMRLLDLQPWFLAAAAIVVISILFWWPFVRSITRALGQLTTATGAIAEGKFDTRVPAARSDELGALGGSVNQMAVRLDSLVNGQQRFLADVAHELGSPIGRLQVAVEILETHAHDPALQSQVADVREEVQQMSALVNELLAFTRAGLRARDAELESIDLAALVALAVRREGGEPRVTTAVPAEVVVRGDAPLLSRALCNLIRNALRYAGADTPIMINARRDGTRVVISIADDGPGVPPDALARLGEPFYRPEDARTRESGGVGLGLAIVRSAISACGGEVRFANRTPHGFLAEISLSSP